MENRFDGLARKLTKTVLASSISLLKVKVWNNGRITLKIKDMDNGFKYAIDFGE